MTTPDAWRRLREVVEEALARPAPDREGWLDAACGSDAALRREAAQLVAAAARDASFLEPVVSASAPGPAALAAGARVGEYRIVRTIGAGGMGAVYEAERDDPRRRVALKVLRDGLTSAGSRARFRYEVEVLAALQHPAVAHMYETGVDARGLPWFAMELVGDARSIVAYARDESLSRAARVALFAKVCDAVHHGHQKGVLHRDLKPDNILVDGQGRPKVIDFGVARAAGADETRTCRTSAGEIIGTLAYMSPEQLAGGRSALDARSDLYSLGVLLYELLSGRLPYDLDGAGLLEAARVIADTPPHPLPSVGDLATVVAKCLAKAPADRYASVAELAADLRRYLNREPVVAHPPSVRYQLRMFARRHKTLVTATAAVVLVSLAAAVVGFVLLQRTRRAEQLAVRRGTDAQRLFATVLERSLATTRDLAPRLGNLAGGGPLSRDLLDQAVADLRVLEGLAHDDPAVLRELAWAHLGLAHVRGDPAAPNHLGDREAAVRGYARALEIARGLVRRAPDDPDALHLLAEAQARAGRLRPLDDAEGDEMLRGAAEIVARLRTRAPAEPRLVDLQTSILRKIGQRASHRGDRATALEHHRRSLALVSGRAAARPADIDLQRRLMSAHMSVASVHMQGFAWNEALEGFDAACRAGERVLATDPDDASTRAQVAYAMFHCGVAKFNLGVYDEADALIAAARRRYERMRAEDPDNVTLPRMVGIVHAELGRFARMRAGSPDADPAERRRLLEHAARSYDTAAGIFAELQRTGRLTRGHGDFAASMRAEAARCRAAIDGPSR